ncbi:atp-binding cassette superfamily [Phytophthora cinnamomi]|uniref:atp-binding cassette superfamily n=1 Tax=Phytophthora cinnamomi TaxID=4785 RepID=UPI00355A26F8|nr:atp-binding cassette superfamily [Phytophthora cinnamomi]
MVSASFALLGALVLFTSTADGSRQFVQRLPNGGNVEGYQAIGHTDGTGNNQATNAFGDAFQKAGNKWSLGLCQADTDGDGQTNGQELGDPCCEWTQSSGNSPRWSSGVSHPSLKDSMSNASLWANINCSAVTTISATSGADSSLTVESATSMFALATGIALLFA